MSLYDPNSDYRLEKLARRGNFKTGEIIQLVSESHSIIKRFSYDYLSDICLKDESVCLIAANHAIKDCTDVDMSVKCSSLYALSSMLNMEGTAISHIEKAMDHDSKIMRGMSAICSMRLFVHAPEAVLCSGLVDKLYAMIRDDDITTGNTCLIVLDKILQTHGHVKINWKMVKYLCLKLRACDNSRLRTIFCYLQRYEPQTSAEKRHIVNSVKSYIRSQNIALTITSLGICERLVKPNRPKFSGRSKTAIVETCKTCSPEHFYALLHYLNGLKIDIRPILVEMTDLLLPTRGDPEYLSDKKFEMLPQSATKANVLAMVAGLQKLLAHTKYTIKALKCMALVIPVDPLGQKKVIEVMLSHFPSCNVQQLGEGLRQLYTALRQIQDYNWLDLNHPSLFPSLYRWLSQQQLIDNHPVVVLRLVQLVGWKIPSIHELFQKLYKSCDQFPSVCQMIFIDSAMILFLKFPPLFKPDLIEVMDKFREFTDKDVQLHANKRQLFLQTHGRAKTLDHLVFDPKKHAQ